MKVTVVVKHSRWSGEGLELAGGTHELDVTAGEIRLLAGAASAGSVEIVHADAKAATAIAAAVEPDKVSLKKQEAAVKDGRWLEGHLEQYALDEAAA